MLVGSPKPVCLSKLPKPIWLRSSAAFQPTKGQQLTCWFHHIYEWQLMNMMVALSVR